MPYELELISSDVLTIPLVDYSNASNNFPVIDPNMSIGDYHGPWRLPLLLCRDVKGGMRQWEIMFDGENLITKYGVAGGAIQEVTRRVDLNMSGRDIFAQGLLEGKKRYADKIQEGYHTVGSDTGFKKPMLAQHYDKHIDKITGDFQLTYQYKIDGERALTSHTSMGITRSTKSNKHIPFMEFMDHECLLLLSYLPQGTVLDGEIYRLGMKYEEIISRCSVGRKIAHPDRFVLQYWIFDIITPEPLTFIERYRLLCDAYNKSQMNYLIVLPLFNCNANVESIRQHLYNAVDNGYEGIMIRNVNANYIHGRTSNLLKVKEFKDAEGVISSVTSGSGTEEGCAMFIIYDPVIGLEFPVRPTGSFEARKHWYNNPHEVIGKYYTYKYFGDRQLGQLPRFPIGMRFRDMYV